METVRKAMLKAATFFTLGICLSLAISSALAVIVTGPEYNFTIGSYACTNQSRAITNAIQNGTRFEGYGTISVKPAAQTGHVGSQSIIYDSANNQYVMKGTWSYSDRSNIGSWESLVWYDFPTGHKGSYFCQSESAVWNGTGYTKQVTYGTPNITIN